MNRAWPLLLMFGVGTVGCSGSRAPSTPPAGTLGPSPAGVAPFQSGLFFAGTKKALGARRYETRVNFGALRDLWIRAAVPTVSTMTSVKLDFISPSGSVFRTYYAYFSPDPTMRTADIAGNPHPVSVTPAESVPGGYHLDFSVAISGSPFVKFPQPGPWVLRADVAGQAQVLSGALAVEVQR